MQFWQKPPASPLCNGLDSDNCLCHGASESKFLVTKFECGGSFGMSLEGDCLEVEVTPNLELLVTFGMSLVGVFLCWHQTWCSFHYY